MNWDAFNLVYVVTVLLAGLLVWLICERLRDRQLAAALIGMLAVFAGEQIYYGLGRATSAALYEGLSWYWPGVLIFKAGYCVALSRMVWVLLSHKERI